VNRRLITALAGLLFSLQSLYFYSLAASAQRSTQPSARLLSRSLLGDIIEDGIGYGGIRIGNTEKELLAKWGSPAQITPDPPQQNYLYSLDSGEFISVQIKNGRVEAMLLLLHSPVPPAPLKTKRGVGLGSPFAELKKIYGNPEKQEGSTVLYVSQGVGFQSEGGLVAAIIVFQPGKPPQ